MIAHKYTQKQYSTFLAMIGVRNFLTLKQRIQNGEAQRCAVCLSWASPREVGSVSIFFPKGGKEPIPYAVCKQCVQKTTSRRKMRAAVAKAEAYLAQVADGQEAAQ